MKEFGLWSGVLRALAANAPILWLWSRHHYTCHVIAASIEGVSETATALNLEVIEPEITRGISVKRVSDTYLENARPHLSPTRRIRADRLARGLSD